MTARAITIRLAEPRDAQPIALMSRDLIESGLGWKYDAPRVLRAIRDRETVAVVARAGIGKRLLEWLLECARTAGISSVHLELRAANEAARRFYRAMGFYETVLVPGYYRSGEGRKEGALRMLRVLRVPGPLPAAWQPPRMPEDPKPR